MSPKKFLSEKKTSTQTISISPALKDWIGSYVRKMREQYPDDERYKSLSAFYCEIMESVLKIFENDKTLDDFNRLQDHEVHNFYNELSSNMFIPFIEPALKADRYIQIDFKTHMRYLLTFFALFRKKTEPDNITSLKNFFERIKKRYLYSKHTKGMNIEFITEKGKETIKGIIEHTGNYNNLHFTNCKLNALVFGLLGVRVNNLFYSDNDIYYRFDLESTDLLLNKKIEKKKRTLLMKENLYHLINYDKILEDEAMHLWLRLVNNDNFIISYKYDEAFLKDLQEIENDLVKFGSNELSLLKLLLFFEKLHWIRILNENDLTFRITLSKQNNSAEIEFFMKYLSEKAQVIEKNGIYTLKNEILDEAYLQ